MIMHERDERRKRICEDQQHNNSGAIVSDSQDLLTSILLLLPAKTLLRLKLVSKQFNCVISSQLFGILHVRMHHKNRESLAPTGLYFYSSFSNWPQIYTVSISNPEKNIPPPSSILESTASLFDSQFKIVQACNGLLLCSIENGNSSYSTFPAREYYVCNPTTQTFTTLPELPPVESSSKSKNEEICHPVHTLAFNPLQTHVYKVFVIRVVKQIPHKCTCEILVYSSDEGGRVWRKAGCQFSIPVGLKKIRHGVFHDAGKITWICERGFIYFDAQAERVMEVPKWPTPHSTWNKIRFFGECIDGRLLLIKRLNNGAGINVSQLKPETSNWKIRGRLHPQFDIYHRHLEIVKETYLHCDEGYCSDMYQILAVAKGGKEVILAIPGMVLRYCHESAMSWVLRLLPQQLPQQFPGNVSFGCVTSFQFVETLSPV